MVDLPDVHKEFLAQPFTTKNVRRDFHEWHRGRQRYAFWAIDVDYAGVRDQVQIAEQHLAEFLLDGYCRQPHVTLGISGFLSNHMQYEDDYDASAIETDILALRNAGIMPFEIEIGNLASFSSAPFLHVRDSAGRLDVLHKMLHKINHDGSAPYVPHVTIGLYAGMWKTGMISHRMAMVPQKNMTRCLIHKISLMTYTAAEIGGRLITVADYDLEKAVIHWQEEPQFTSN